MPDLTLTVSYDGADAEIIQALSRMATAFSASNKSNDQTPGSRGPGWPEKVAQKFVGYVSHAAARGEDSQQAVLCFWLKRDGVAPLDDLVKASGVSKTH